MRILFLCVPLLRSLIQKRKELAVVLYIPKREAWKNLFFKHTFLTIASPDEREKRSIFSFFFASRASEFIRTDVLSRLVKYYDRCDMALLWSKQASHS
jgi:hypothetical protein